MGVEAVRDRLAPSVQIAFFFESLKDIPHEVEDNTTNAWCRHSSGPKKGPNSPERFRNFLPGACAKRCLSRFAESSRSKKKPKPRSRAPQGAPQQRCRPRLSALLRGWRRR